MNNYQKLTKRIDWHQKKWYASWHTWAGLFAGSILIIVALTGCILVFEKEIDVALNPDLFEYEKVGERLSFEQATNCAKKEYPKLQFNGIYKKEELNDIYELLAPIEGSKLEEQKFQQIYVNPYSGKVTGRRIYKETFIGFIREIHTSLLIPAIGKYLVGISSLTCLILIITGLRLWIPNRLRQVRKKLMINFKKSNKRVNYDLHNVLGVYFSPIIGMLSLSGVMITFAQFFFMFLFLLNFQSPVKLIEMFQQQSLCEKKCETLSITEVISFAKKEFKSAKIKGVNFPADKKSIYLVMMSEKSDSELGSVLLVYVNQYTGKIQLHSNKEEFRLANVYFNWIDAIHFGKFGGWPTRILVFIGSLVLVIMFVSGFIIWIPRWRKGKNYIEKINMQNNNKKIENMETKRIEQHPVNPRIRISILWLLLLIGIVFHTQFELSELFVKTDIRIKEFNGESPAFIHYLRILIIFSPMLFSLGVLYFENKVFKITLFVVAILLMLLNSVHLVEEVFIKTSFDLSQGILLTIVLIVNVLLVWDLNKWRLFGKKKD